MKLAKLLPFYIGGQVRVSNKDKNYVFVCGINNLYVKDGILRFEFIWALKLENLDEINKVWIHHPEHLREEIDLTFSKIFPKKEKGIICIKSGENDDLFELQIANKSFIDEMTLLRAKNHPISLRRDLENLKIEIISKIDFNKIPKINFCLEEIAGHKSYLFMRVDLINNGKIFPFIRISKKNISNCVDILNDFLDEISYIFSLKISEIDFILRADGDIGLLSCTQIDNCFNVHVSGNGKTPDLTEDLLKEVFCNCTCVIDKVSDN